MRRIISVGGLYQALVLTKEIEDFRVNLWIPSRNKTDPTKAYKNTLMTYKKFSKALPFPFNLLIVICLGYFRMITQMAGR